jgi:hypothetical protein
MATEDQKCNAVCRKSYLALAGVLSALKLSSILFERDSDCLILTLTAPPRKVPREFSMILVDNGGEKALEMVFASRLGRNDSATSRNQGWGAG